MYLDRPANRLQSPSGFLSSEQVPPLSLLHVGASTPGFYAKSRCFIFFSKLLLLKVNFQNFISFFYGNTATFPQKFVRRNGRFNVSIIVESIFNGR